MPDEIDPEQEETFVRSSRNDGWHPRWLPLSIRSWSLLGFTGQMNWSKVQGCHADSHWTRRHLRAKKFSSLSDSVNGASVICWFLSTSRRMYAFTSKEFFSASQSKHLQSNQWSCKPEITETKQSRLARDLCYFYLIKLPCLAGDILRNSVFRYFLISFSDINTCASFVNWGKLLHLHTSSDVEYHRPFQEYQPSKIDRRVSSIRHTYWR